MRKHTVVIIIFLMLCIVSCGKGKKGTEAGKITIEVWFHSGQGSERNVLNAQVANFNKAHDDITIIAKQLPEGSYTEQINAAALSGDLPDLLDFDGPFVYNFVWAGYLQPIDQYIEKDILDDFLPSIIKQGTYKGRLYSLGTFDSGLGLFANKKYLEKAGIRIPEGLSDTWNSEECKEALKKLQALPEVEYALDLKMNYGRGEWFTYGFSPILQSFNADLIDRKDFQSADNVLNSPEAVEAMTLFQSWFKNGYTKYNPGGDTDFADGKAALSYVGHWMYNPSKEALGENLVLLPMPKFGEISVTGMGSWNWGLTKECKNPEAAIEFLKYLIQPDQIIRMTNANGAIPARKSAIERIDLFKKDGDLHIYIEQLEKTAIPRPQTPAYSVITTAFAEAVDNIAQGANVKDELDNAVKKIDQDIIDNKGYR
jgi:multiple sugar transport system substrate-binding protein